MESSKDSLGLFPGSTGVSIIILVLGIVLVLIAVLPNVSQVVSGIITGLGSAMFLAGFLGLVNLRVLSRELQNVTRRPFEEMAILTQIRGAGIEWVTREREELVAEKILPSIERERQEIVVVGSSLKGLIGLGFSTSGPTNRVRKALVDALTNHGANVSVLMTHPETACLRSGQEGRLKGDIEEEILKNLMYLVKLKKDNPQIAKTLKIGLYQGTPTMFMLSTTEMMLINPYPYYATAFSSFSFLVKSGSVIFSRYYDSHYKSAWTDKRTTQHLPEEVPKAVEKIRQLILGQNLRGDPIIPDRGKQEELLEDLNQI